jgi:hypothetical protein
VAHSADGVIRKGNRTAILLQPEYCIDDTGGSRWKRDRAASMHALHAFFNPAERCRLLTRNLGI